MVSSDSVHTANNQICKCVEELGDTSNSSICRSGISSTKLGAVLVLLYENAGQLRVLLTTRSKLLRAHPGQTALPGGKADETDLDLTHTAVSPLHPPPCAPSHPPPLVLGHSHRSPRDSSEKRMKKSDSLSTRPTSTRSAPSRPSSRNPSSSSPRSSRSSPIPRSSIRSRPPPARSTASSPTRSKPCSIRPCLDRNRWCRGGARIGRIPKSFT